MKISEVLEYAVKELSTRGLTYAVAGGVAAGLYRDIPRFTKDVDLLVSGASVPTILREGEQIMRNIGLTPTIAREAHLRGGKIRKSALETSNPVILVGSSKADGYVGLDFLLPTLPWVSGSVERAQFNKLPLTEGTTIPCITRDDLLIAKLYALSGSQQRPKDLDDIKSMLSDSAVIDHTFIGAELARLEIMVARNIREVLPKELQFLLSHGKERKRLKKDLGL